MAEEVERKGGGGGEEVEGRGAGGERSRRGEEQEGRGGGGERRRRGEDDGGGRAVSYRIACTRLTTTTTTRQQQQQERRKQIFGPCKYSALTNILPSKSSAVRVKFPALALQN